MDKGRCISKDTTVNAAISACEICGQRDFAVSLLQTSELQLGKDTLRETNLALEKITFHKECSFPTPFFRMLSPSSNRVSLLPSVGNKAGRWPWASSSSLFPWVIQGRTFRCRIFVLNKYIMTWCWRSQFREFHGHFSYTWGSLLVLPTHDTSCCESQQGDAFKHESPRWFYGGINLYQCLLVRAATELEIVAMESLGHMFQEEVLL